MISFLQLWTGKRPQDSLKRESDFKNVNCFVFEKGIVFHKASVQNIYNVYYFKTLSMCIFNTVEIQSGIGFIVDALLRNFAYLTYLLT